MAIGCQPSAIGKRGNVNERMEENIERLEDWKIGTVDTYPSIFPAFHFQAESRFTKLFLDLLFPFLRCGRCADETEFTGFRCPDNYRPNPL